MYDLKRVIPLVTVDDARDVTDIIAALDAAGYGCAEITLRTSAGVKAIALAAAQFPNMLIGAGSVLSAETCLSALDAGARFIVSPGLSDSVAALCIKRCVPYYPGCVTPTEIMRAISLGITTVKYFPADVFGGLKAMKALSAPFPQVKFIPTGGIDVENVGDYLAWDKVAAVGGSSFTKAAVEKWAKS